MYPLRLLLLFALIALAFSAAKFSTKDQFYDCIDVCKSSISLCLSDHNSACAKAYAKCHQTPDFLACMESSNGLLTQ